MGRLHQAACLDDAPGQHLLPVRPESELDTFRSRFGSSDLPFQAASLGLLHRSDRNHKRENAALPSARTASGRVHPGSARAYFNILILRPRMSFIHDPEFGDRMITLMAALVLVLQIAAVAQRWLMANIRIFALQSVLLAAIAGTIAFFNHANHVYIAALLTLILKGFVLPLILARVVERVGIRQEIEPLIDRKSVV